MTGALLSLALAAAAHPPEILLPPWPLSPEGELVGVAGEAPLAASGASAERVAPGVFRVVPQEGAAEVRLSAGSATAVADVEPPPARISITVTPPAPTKGKDREVSLQIAVEAPPGEAPDPRPPEIVASSGRVRGLAPAGPGRFRAVYELAPTLHPEVAALLALVPRCPTCAMPRAVGYAVVPVSAAIDLPGTSDPGVRTSVTIAGRTFGPTVADAKGRFSIPVVVPPGAQTGIGDSVDPLGNRKRTDVDLRLPAVNRLACAAWPRAVRADGRSRASIWCVASTASGTAEPDATLVISAAAGSASLPATFRGALQRSTLRAPSGGGGRDAVVTASYPAGGPSSTAAIRVALATGTPAEIRAEVPGEPVGLGASVPAITEVRDANGDPIGKPSGPPGASVGFVAPDRFVARSDPGDYVQRAPLSFALPPGGEPEVLSLLWLGGTWLAVARTIDGRPVPGAELRFGAGPPARTNARGEARVEAERPTETVVAANGARAAGFEGFALAPPPFEIATTVAVALRPPAPVDVSARIEGGWLRWRVVDARGAALPGRAVALRAASVALGPPEPDADGGRAEVRGGRGPVAVVDAATGIAAVVEVP